MEREKNEVKPGTKLAKAAKKALVEETLDATESKFQEIKECFKRSDTERAFSTSCEKKWRIKNDELLSDSPVLFKPIMIECYMPCELHFSLLFVYILFIYIIVCVFSMFIFPHVTNPRHDSRIKSQIILLYDVKLKYLTETIMKSFEAHNYFFGSSRNVHFKGCINFGGTSSSQKLDSVDMCFGLYCKYYWNIFTAKLQPKYARIWKISHYY